MNDVIGIELTASRARAAAFAVWRRHPHAWHELSFDADRPAELVARLRERFGETRRVALSIGLAYLHVKYVKLPPAPAAARRRMLALEPDRFFPVQGAPLAIALANEADYAFAIDAALLERWLSAFSTYAPVDAVEPAPLSLARALGNRASGSFALPAGNDEHGVVELSDGALQSARRVPVTAGAMPATQSPTAVNAMPAEFACAAGVAGAVTAPIETLLLTETHGAALSARRSRRVVFAATLCLAAFLLAFWAVDRSRERTLERLRTELAAVTPRAAAALELNDRLAGSEREARATAELTATRSDPLDVLHALGALPPDATVLQLRALGNDWQIDGRASDAAAIVAMLAANAQFEDVRFLSASSRFRENNRTYETFSIAFRVRPSA